MSRDKKKGHNEANDKSSHGDILNMDTNTKLGGAYIPRAKLRMMAASITDKNSLQYQRMMWEELKKSINGTINKANVSNLAFVVKDLIKENLIRGRGLIVRCCIRAQNVSQTFTHVYAALIAVINTKFPQIGELLLKRLINQFKRAFKRNDKEVCISSTRFLAHLFNQNVVHEITILEILTLLLNNPTDDSIEVTVALIKECGNKMTDVCPRGLNAIFDTLRSILHTGDIDRRVQYMIEVLFAIRKDEFKDFPTVVKELDIVEEEDQYTHTLTLDEEYDNEQMLDVFKFDPQYQETEEKYKLIRDEILGKSDDEEGESSSHSSSENESSENEEGEDENEAESECIYDNTETNLVSLRRTIYLTIQSSVHFEECAHKLLKMNLKPGQEAELCQMILDACAQQRTYEKFFGLLAHRFCMLKRVYVEQFEKIFGEQYEIVHRLETVKLRNIAKFFAHLFCTDAISWGVLSCISLNEDDTTSSSRVFIKNLFLELAENCGMQDLNDRLQNPELAQFFTGLFPRDNPRDTRFSINFFTSIGLGGLTEELREYLKNSSSEKVPRKKSRKH